MRVSRDFVGVFDDPNLVSCAGLVPVLALAERAGPHDLVGGHVTIAAPGGTGADVKVTALVAGMVAGADSIDDMEVLRHGAMGRLFSDVRAPSTLGTFLRGWAPHKPRYVCTRGRSRPSPRKTAANGSQTTSGRKG